MKQMGFYIDTATCIGCKTCEIACKDQKNLPLGVRLRKVKEFGGGSWQEKDGFMVPSDVFTYFVSSSCMHCAKPACQEVCPVQAISKNNENGIVTIDKEKCIGCRSCIEACPYKAPSFNEREEKTYKCDMCADRISQGKNPECVDSCLQRSLKFGTLEELKRKYGKTNAVAPLPNGNLTDPSIVIRPHGESGRAAKGRVRNATEL